MPEDSTPQRPEPAQPELHKFQDLGQTPDVYADAVNLHAGEYTFALVFGTRGVGGQPDKPQVIVRISPQMAAKVSELLSRLVRTYEKASGMKIAPRAPRTQSTSARKP